MTSNQTFALTIVRKRITTFLKFYFYHVLIKRTILLLLFALLFNSAFAEMINIGLYHKYKITSFVFHPEKGTYSIFTDKGKLLDVDKGEVLEVKYSSAGISIKSLDKDFDISTVEPESSDPVITRVLVFISLIIFGSS